MDWKKIKFDIIIKNKIGIWFSTRHFMTGSYGLFFSVAYRPKWWPKFDNCYPQLNFSLRLLSRYDILRRGELV